MTQDQPTPSPQSWQAQAAAMLDALTGPHAQTKRETIIAIVDARLAGRTEESVWRLPQVCNRTTYHLRWKKDPTFATALKTIHEMALNYKNTRALAALQQSAENLALASPVAVAKLVKLLNSEKEEVALRAVLGLLDRAGVETAKKAQADVTVSLPPNIETMLEKVYGASDTDDEQEDAGETEQETDSD